MTMRKRFMPDESPEGDRIAVVECGIRGTVRVKVPTGLSDRDLIAQMKGDKHVTLEDVDLDSMEAELFPRKVCRSEDPE